MLLCNANAGFYEFSYYQSEWIEYYSKLGINLMLWNYQGFGRTKGSPNLKKIFNDGKAIINFLRTEKQVRILGIHGESLGGCVAAHLANKCNLNFLFADRTFSSLSDVSFFNFGRIAFYGFKVSARNDSNASKDFIETKCYKIISCDPKDIVINNLASLKAGVAWSIFYKKFPLAHILIKEHFKDFYNSLIRISQLILNLSHIENSDKENKIDLNKTTYHKLKEDSELLEDGRFRAAIQRIKIILNGIDAGGIPLLECLKSKNPEKSLVSWITVLDL